jgi:hypothetical protein
MLALGCALSNTGSAVLRGEGHDEARGGASPPRVCGGRFTSRPRTAGLSAAPATSCGSEASPVRASAWQSSASGGPKQLLPARSSRLGHRPRARSTAKIVPAPVVCSQRLGPCAAASRFGARELVVRDAVTMAEGLHDAQSLPATLAVRTWFAANRAVTR